MTEAEQGGYDESRHRELALGLRDRIDAGHFAIALSGGGHRASLAALGALMAIVDRGLAGNIIQVASVSGGSVTNAFIAQRCQLDELEPEGLDDLAREMASTIVLKGVLTRGWIATLLLGPILLGGLTGILLEVFVAPWIFLAIVTGLLVGCLALMMIGKVTDRLLHHRYFRPGSSARQSRGVAPLASLGGRSVDHLFCMTDLVLGLPVYASPKHGGMIYRRLKPDRDYTGSRNFQTFADNRLTIAEVVRASAAFPGIPPRRLRIPSDSRLDSEGLLPRLAFLGDGGLWNNLATQALREDEFIASFSEWDAGVLRPYYGIPRDIPLLCFNGSAPLSPTRPWPFRVPGFAQLRSLLQVTRILSANTVIPRVEATTRAFVRRAARADKPNELDPVNLIVDLSPAELIDDVFTPGAWAHRPAGRNEAAWPAGYPVGWPQDWPAISGLASLEDWDALRRAHIWKELVREEGGDSVDVPTTLGRIESGVARRLIARGYLNTYLVSLFLAPLGDHDLERLSGLAARFDRIVPTIAPERA